MTRVCLLGKPDVEVGFELLSRETAREALSAYDLRRPYENSLTMETVSLGAAVSLLNDLDWYLTRFVADTLVLEPSVSEDEWLSRDLATAIRNDEIEPEDTDEFLKIYGVVEPDAEDGTEPDEGATASEDDTEPEKPRLVDPLYVRRTDDEVPEYDLREVDDTLRVRITGAEFD